MVNKNIGISEDKMKHILEVARECYKIAKSQGYDEEFCERMFMLGWTHDVGYEFVEDSTKHGEASERLMKHIGVSNNDKSSAKALHCVRTHGHVVKTASPEWVILNTADMTVNSKGEHVSIYERLEDIKERYGEDSSQYVSSCEVAEKCGLLTQQTV